jgi:hypothetical protein
MAQTRGATGNSKPRVFPTISTEPVRKPRTTTGTKKAKATGITKKRAPATQHKRKPSLKDKVVGAVEKAVGSVESKPGKKAAGTKKIRGTDGKNSKTTKVKKI